jgi:uncharacterized protein YlxP (DUF503 family)
MFIGVLQFRLFIGESLSLKSKRHVLRRLKDKIRANFNVSISEVGENEKWQKSVLAVACVGKDKKYINGVLSRISDLVESYSQAEVIDVNLEI